MLQIYFDFFDVGVIRRFASTCVAICSATSYPFGSPSIIKITPICILKFLFTTLGNQDDKFAFIRVDENGALTRSSEFINTCHTMNIMVQTVGWGASSLNGKIESPNLTLYNNTGSLLLKSSHKKELWWFSYQYAIWISLQKWKYITWGCYLLLLACNNTFIKTHQNMGCEILRHQLTCYR